MYRVCPLLHVLNGSVTNSAMVLKWAYPEFTSRKKAQGKLRNQGKMKTKDGRRQNQMTETPGLAASYNDRRENYSILENCIFAPFASLTPIEGARQLLTLLNALLNSLRRFQEPFALSDGRSHFFVHASISLDRRPSPTNHIR